MTILKINFMFIPLVVKPLVVKTTCGKFVFNFTNFIKFPITFKGGKMIQDELKERILYSALISPFVLVFALVNIENTLFSVYIFTFILTLVSTIVFETFRMYESKFGVAIPKIKKFLFLVLAITVTSLISLVLEDNGGVDKILKDLSTVSYIVMLSYVFVLVFNLSVSALKTTKHNYLVVDTLFTNLSLYVGLTLGVMMAIKFFDIYNKTYFVAFLLAVGWISELGGLIGGKYFGKIKLSFMASPKKTVEGTVGSLIFAILAGIAFKGILDLIGYQSRIFLENYASVVILSLIIFVFDFFGDIIESLIKRYFDVKDSSNIFKALGGVFDIFDGVMLGSLGVLLYIIIR
jgi:phosphatidate cytidylyltransferase